MIETYSELFLVLTGLLLSIGAKLYHTSLKLGAQETSKGYGGRKQWTDLNILILCFMNLRTFSALQAVKLMWWLKSREGLKCTPRSLIIETFFDMVRIILGYDV